MNQELQILFITHNSSAVIGNAIAPLYGHFPIVIVDNASSDGELDNIRQKFPEIEIIELPQNIGYGRASNVIIENTKYPYIYLLNPDIITSKNDIDILLEKSKSLEDCAISGPNLSLEAHKIIEADSIIGCAMLFNIEKMRLVGGFDPEIFLYGEENDLCYRVKKAGLKMYLIGDSFVEHLSRKSSPHNEHYIFLRKFHHTYSRFYLKAKHDRPFKAKRLALLEVMKASLKWAIAPLVKQDQIEQKARIYGAIHFLSGKKAFKDSGIAYYYYNISTFL